MFIQMPYRRRIIKEKLQILFGVTLVIVKTILLTQIMSVILHGLIIRKIRLIGIEKVQIHSGSMVFI